jgi:cyclophilin family peptidyl-prolyl cis-trans isomerase
MANAGTKHNGSQFFITLEAAPGSTQQNTRSFGKVCEGRTCEADQQGDRIEAINHPAIRAKAKAFDSSQKLGTSASARPTHPQCVNKQKRDADRRSTPKVARPKPDKVIFQKSTARVLVPSQPRQQGVRDLQGHAAGRHRL